MNLSFLKFFVFFSVLILGARSGLAVDAESMALLSPPKALPLFHLQSADKKQFKNSDLHQHWSLLFFGFTQCQMVCPTTMTKIKEAYENLEKNKKIMPQMIFVSLDSEHDTPMMADAYAKSFNPRFMGLSGDAKQIQLLTKHLGVLFMKVKQNGSDTIDHSANLFLMDPNGAVRAILSPPYEPKQLAREIAKATSLQ